MQGLKLDSCPKFLLRNRNVYDRWESQLSVTAAITAVVRLIPMQK